jgi:hypothetical protein
MSFNVAGYIGEMGDTSYRFDFVVRDDGSVDEPAPEGKTVFERQISASPALEALRAALDADPRWRLHRVSATRPQGDQQSRRHVVVWVGIDADLDPENVRRTLASVETIVNEILPDASLVSLQQTSPL